MVGTEMLEVINERGFKFDELFLVASKNQLVKLFHLRKGLLNN